MAKLTLNTIGSRYGSIDALNDNFNAIETAIENTFSLDGTSPNALEADLDMNSNAILNASEVDTTTLRINGVLVEPGTSVTAGAAFQTYAYTATAGQTTFSVSPATPYNASIVVIVNGLQLSPSEINVSGTNVITPALTLGDEVVIRRYTAEPVAAPDATEVNFIQAGTGAVTRTSQNKMRDVVSVKDFGAVGDSVTDDTVAIQAAFNAMGGAIGGIGGGVYFPAGYYKVTAPITISHPGYYYGEGWGTRLVTNSTTANIFNITAQQVSIESLTFASSVTRSGGYYVDVASGASRFRLSHFSMEGAHTGIRTLAAATVTIEQGQILNSIASTGTAIRIDAGLDVSIRDILVDSSSQIFSGIYITNAGDVSIEDCQLLTAGSALYLEAGVGNVISSLWANNTFFDNSIRGLYALAAGGSIVRCLFDQCWFASSSLQNILLASSGGGSINGMDFNGCHVFLSATSNGIQIQDSGVTNVRVHDSIVAQNALAGISVSANVGDVSIQDNRIGASHGLSANNNGIVFVAGSGNNIQVLNNDLRGNTVSNLSNGATGLNVIIDNNLGANESWSTFTPTITTGSGTITTLGTVVGKYQKIGKKLFITLSIPITTNGTGAVDVKATLPTGIAAATDCILVGRENNVTGSQLQASILATSGVMSITKYDNTYPGGSGYKLLVTGIIEVQ